MFGRVPKTPAPFLGTRPNISDSHSEISTRVPFCIATQLSDYAGHNTLVLNHSTFMAARAAGLAVSYTPGPSCRNIYRVLVLTRRATTWMSKSRLGTYSAHS